MSTENTQAPVATETAAEGHKWINDAIFKVGQSVKFKAYAVAPGEGESPKFQEGDILKLETLGPDKNTESYEAIRLSDGQKDTVFFDEIESYVAPVEEKSPGKAKKAPKTDEEKAAEAAKKAAEKAEKDAKKAAEKAVKDKERAEAKAKKEAEEAAALQPLVLTAGVESVIGTSAAETLEAAETLSKQVDTSEFILGGVLAKVKRENLHTSILDAEGKPVYSNDKAGFEAYADARLSCGYRKALYLIGIYETYSALGVTEEEISKVGWTKAMLLRGSVNKDNVKELLEFAETNNKTAVEEKVSSMRVNAGDPPPQPRGVAHSFKFTLYNDKGETAKAALAQAKQENGADSTESDAFYRILMEWSQLRLQAAQVETPVAEAQVEQAAQPAQTEAVATA